MLRLVTLLSLVFNLLAFSPNYAQHLPDSLIRALKHNHHAIKTTFNVDDKFYGKYSGKKSGYLLLNKDGTGIYKYDSYLFLPENCDEEEITFLWGFLTDENGEIVKFERDYGLSYPILYSCNGESSFQGCSKTSMIDYLLVHKDGTIAVSSSDDWEKEEH